MKLTVVAATGGIGRQIVDQAVAAGHDVTTVVRDPSKLTQRVPAVVADLAAPDPTTLRQAIAGSDAVLSGLGARTRSEAGVASRGTRAIVEAMQADGTRRLVVVSAAPVGTVPSPGRPHPPRRDPGDGFVMRNLLTPAVKVALGWVYDDLARMEETVRDSGLDWTVVRPPRLNNRGLTGRYRSAYGRNLRRGLSISRADVAHLMLHLLEEPETIGQVVGIAY
ncbi:MAG: NAD(P)-dependent oxidoreductase [Candidatus Dormibacteria bacterium]